jgi:hypothetical protein
MVVRLEVLVLAFWKRAWVSWLLRAISSLAGLSGVREGPRGLGVTRIGHEQS